MRRSSIRVTPVAALESRQLLSGNVTLQLSGATVTLTGDNSSNSIAIRQDVGGGMVVQALNGTKLNGISNGSQTFSNPTVINLDLKGGDDNLNLKDYLGGQLTLQLGSGNDTLTANSTVCDASFIVDLGSGNDKFTMSGLSDKPSQNAVNLEIKGNSGNDRIRLDHTTVGQKLLVDCGNGNDSFGAIGCQFAGETQIDLGTGNDLLGLSSSRLTGAVNILGNTGEDIAGLDSLQCLAAVAIDMGEGKDGLLTHDNRFEGNLSRIGGNATDLSYKSTDLVLGTETISGFEVQATTLTSQVNSLLSKLNAAFPV